MARSPSPSNPAKSLHDVRTILIRKGLLEPKEELTEAMLEDLVHFAYFTGCVTKGEVRRLLGLTAEEARERIRSWKMWQDGNRSCQLRQNPFYEEWPAEGDE
jgi:hypothetical protein